MFSEYMTDPLRCAILLALGLAGGACRSAPKPEPAHARRAEPVREQHLAGQGSATSSLTADAALVIYSAGIDALFADPRDAGLRRALSMLDDRLIELRNEQDGGPPPELLELLFDVLAAPLTLSVDLGAGGGEPGPPVRAELLVRTASASEADALAQRLESVLATIGWLDAPVETGPVEAGPGLKSVALPVGKLYYGRTREGDHFLVSFGKPWTIWPELDGLGLPPGVAPVLAFGVDMTRVRDPLLMLLALAGEQAAIARRQLEWSGLLGKHPFGVTFALGQGTDRARWVSRQRNWVEANRASGALATEPLSPAELRLVPEDATFASLVKLDPYMLVSLLEAIAEDAPEDPLEVIEGLLGIDLDEDLCAPLGSTMGFYLSDTTGGGGLTSAVFFQSVEDEARVGATIRKLAAKLEELADAEADGRVRVRAFEHRGIGCLGLVFPGLPVPIEPSLALQGGHLFAAATPQALAAALDHARGGAAGLPAHPAFRSLARGALDELQSLAFSDTPRQLRDGHGIATLAAAALANAVRSPTAEREPGLVLPPYHELLAGARPWVQLGRIDGADLVTVGEGDRSVSASCTALMAWAPAFFIGAAMIGTIGNLAVPQVEESLSVAEQAQARADVLAIASALDFYASEHDGRYPDALEALVTPDEEGYTYLDGDTVPLDPWGNEYGYEPPAADGDAVRVFSLGADGVPGGEDEDRDIDNLEEWDDEGEMEEWEEWEEGDDE